MTEPTKGPWVWRHDYEHRNIYGSDTRMVATTAGVAHDAKEIHANALLIAAAPDLLAALENLVDDCGRFDAYDGYGVEDEESVVAARAAIAKAKGDVTGDALTELCLLVGIERTCGEEDTALRIRYATKFRRQSL